MSRLSTILKEVRSSDLFLSNIDGWIVERRTKKARRKRRAGEEESGGGRGQEEGDLHCIFYFAPPTKRLPIMHRALPFVISLKREGQRLGYLKPVYYALASSLST